MVCLPGAVQRRQFMVKALLMLLGAALLAVLCRDGGLDLLPGLLLFGVFLVYLVNNVLDARAGMRESRAGGRPGVFRRQMAWKLLSFAVGITAIVIGSRLLIDHGSALALLLGVPSSIVGVTMVAVGTSLPELVTTLTALSKKGVDVCGEHHRRQRDRPDHDLAGVFRRLRRAAADRATDQCAGPACLFDALRGVGAAAVADRAVLPLARGADAGAVRRIRGAFGAVRLLRAGGRMGEISLRPASGYYFIFST